jgi:hypothetical protein
MYVDVRRGPLGAPRGIDTAELLDVFLSHAGTLSPFTLAKLAVCSKESQIIVKLHIKVISSSSSGAACQPQQH